MYDFVKAIMDKEQLPTNFERGYQIERVCEAVLKSAETNKWEHVLD
jgi:predicted dehydrogenase